MKLYKILFIFSIFILNNIVQSADQTAEQHDNYAAFTGLETLQRSLDNSLKTSMPGYRTPRFGAVQAVASSCKENKATREAVENLHQKVRQSTRQAYYLYKRQGPLDEASRENITEAKYFHAAKATNKFLNQALLNCNRFEAEILSSTKYYFQEASLKYHQ